jgi:hypothetical protein
MDPPYATMVRSAESCNVDAGDEKEYECPKRETNYRVDTKQGK